MGAKIDLPVFRLVGDVADKLGISQSYISRLEKKIISKLKKDISKQIN